MAQTESAQNTFRGHDPCARAGMIRRCRREQKEERGENREERRPKREEKREEKDKRREKSRRKREEGREKKEARRVDDSSYGMESSQDNDDQEGKIALSS